MHDTSPSPAPAEPNTDAAPAAAPVTSSEMSPNECAQALKQRFPALFGGPVKPLKLRIQADIQERAPGVFTKRVLSAFLRRHTGATSYLIAITRAPHRFDLDGQPAGEISEEHRQVAAEELARRRTLRQEREQQEEAARRERAQLLRDFERSPLTPANFCALKGLAPEALEAQLALAREEAAARPPLPPAGPRRDDRREGRPPRDAREARGPQDAPAPRGPRGERGEHGARQPDRRGERGRRPPPGPRR